MSVDDPRDPSIADRNVERLLSTAYHPEAPHADLLGRVQERMCAAASTAAHARPELKIATAPTDPVEAAHLTKVRWRLTWVTALAASLAIVALAWHAVSYRQPGKPGAQLNGLAKTTANFDDPTGTGCLTCQPSLACKTPELVDVGREFHTEAGQRRRVALPDGSILYVNQNTTVRLDANRQVTLTAGEVFVEVSPRANLAERFVIHTPQRQITALGTKFAVRADSDKTRVVVTQGRVKVNDTEVGAGQQLESDKTEQTPAQRASCVLDWTRDLMTAAESPLVPDSKYSGGALVAVDPYGQEAKLGLRNYRVDVYIEDGFARTVIDQTYFNHNNWRMEGTFFFPLPADASLSRLAMYVDGNLMEGGMAERDYAQRVYQEIVTSQRDPALLEWVDGSTFKMRVFPLEARQEKRILIGYTQRLSSLYGRAQYRFPAGHTLGMVNEWQFHAHVKNGAGLAWNCDSHTLKAKIDGTDLMLDARLTKEERKKGTKLNRDVVVEFADPLGAAAAPTTQETARFSTAQHEDNRYVMLRYRPALAVQQQRQQRDWVFLFESSGDRDPLLARVQVDVIRTLLANAEHYDTFAIVTAGTRVHSFRANPVQVTPENVKAAVEFLESSHLIGALNLNEALTATEKFLKAGPNPHLVHVGSGNAAMGEKRPDVLASRIPTGTRYVGVGVGKRWSRAFMKNAAERTGGYFTQINPDEPVSWRAFELSATLNTPRLMNVKVVGDSKNPFLAFGTTLAQGEELCAVARFGARDRLPNAITVTGLLDGRVFEEQIPLPDANGMTQAGHLPRTWAKLEIDRLLAEDSQRNKSAITELSKAMYVMTPFTSLLVLENEEMYKRFKVDTGRKDHWAPYDSPRKIPVVYEPLPGDPVDPRFAPKTTKPHANEILSTILVRVPAPMLTWPDRQEHYYGQVVLTSLHVYRGAFASPYPGGGAGQAKQVEELDGRPASRGVDHDPLSLNDLSSLVLAGSLADKDLAPADAPVAMDELQKMAAAAPRNAPVSFSRLGRVMRSEERWGALPLRDAFERPMPEPGFKSDSFGVDELEDRRKLNRAMRQYAYRELAKSAKSGKDLLTLFGEEVNKKTVDEKEKSPSKADYRLGYLVQGARRAPRLYGRPVFGHHDRVFSDLVSYAPGMTTSYADVQAVREAEAMPGLASMPGRIDDDVRPILDRARTAGWRSLKIGSGATAYNIVFDGRGRYAYSRTLPSGLGEQVACDGTTLMHLYPDLGIGARRTVSRFHRTQLSDLVPWLVPPAEDLARGADLKKVDDHTVAVLPRNAADLKDEDGNQRAYGAIHLIFAADGRLAERRIIEMPSGKMLFTETYDQDKGILRLTNLKGDELSKRELKLADAAEPVLSPDVSKLVVLPLPYRSREHVYRSASVRRQDIFDPRSSWTLEYIDRDEALALFAAEFAVNDGHGAQHIYEKHFATNGEHKLGFFTLLASCGITVSSHPDFLALQEQAPTNPLVGYLAIHSNRLYSRLQQKWGLYLGADVGPKGSFLQSLAAFRDLYLRWHANDIHRPWQVWDLADEEKRALEFVKQNKSARGWAALSVLQDRAVRVEFYDALAAACKQFDDSSELGYAARYEHARIVFDSGKRLEAAALFRNLYQELLKEGILPPIDGKFREALQSDGKTDHWTALMRQTGETLLKENHRSAVVSLAWQCQQLGDTPLADNLIALALKNPKDDKERLEASAAALEYLLGTSQYVQADALIQPLLADAKFNQRPMLWRLGAQIAETRGQSARSIHCLEQALDLEYQTLPEVINLQQVRNDYNKLLQHYDWLAGASNAMNIAPPKDLLARTVKAADRWRALDRSSPQPCNTAASVLKTLGARDLAWEYLTTPIGLQPNESGPWQNLAHQLSYQGDTDLANLAFTAAFEADPTDANMLWDQAQNLRRAGKAAEAQRLLKRIADGDWDQRFNWLKSQARWQLEGR